MNKFRNTIIVLILNILLTYSQIPQEMRKEISDHYIENGAHPLFDGKVLCDGGALVKNNYVIMDDVIIEEGSTLTFIGGTNLYMMGNKKIIVKGRLQLIGESANQISIKMIPEKINYESDVNINWDGIYIEKTGFAEMSFTNISGSNFGVISDSVNKLKHIDKCSFSENKYSDFKIKDKEVKVKPGYINNFDLMNNVNKELYGTPYKKVLLEESLSIQDKRSARKKRIITQVISIATCISGSTLIIIGQDIYDKNYESYKNEDQNSNKAVNYYNNSVKGRNIRNVGIGLGSAGIIGFSISFVF